MSNSHPTLAGHSREDLGLETRKTILTVIITGILGYAGGLVVPPSAIYDRFFRQDPNDLTGTWVGSAGGTLATLILQEGTNPKLKGTLTIKYSQEDRVVTVQGNHDGNVALQGSWDASNDIKIGLNRKVGERFGPDDKFVMLLRISAEEVPILICPKKVSLNIASKSCHPLGEGMTYFAREKL